MKNETQDNQKMPDHVGKFKQFQSIKDDTDRIGDSPRQQ